MDGDLETKDGTLLSEKPRRELEQTVRAYLYGTGEHDPRHDIYLAKLIQLVPTPTVVEVGNGQE